MASKCLFVKYTSEFVDDRKENHVSYNTLLNKCMCEKCMEEKAGLERMRQREKKG